jgi:PAS domain S-box-containing protein
MVSPENSEDGNLPTVADSLQQIPGKYASSQLPVQTLSSQVLMQQGVPLAPAPPGTVYHPVGAQLVAGVGLLQPQQQFTVPATLSSESAQKRRRLETTSANGVAAFSAASTSLNAQALAAAAEQAMHSGRSRRKSQDQIDRRRERNRILARRTRLRKKFFFESLQKEVMDLQRENEMLKGVVKDDIGGDESKKILDTCDAAERMPPGVLEACNEGGFDLDSQDFNLVKSIQTSQHSFIITDPSLADNPIVFASDGFLELTGYERDQVLGRNCRFLQGTDTSQESVEEVRNAIKNGVDVSVTMINYTADGTPFWNKLFIAALRDAQNNIVNFIGVVVKVATPEPGHPDHGKTFDDVKYDSLNGDEKAESTFMAMEDSVSAAVAAASGNPF